MEKRLIILSLVAAFFINVSFAQKDIISNAEKKYDNVSYVKATEKLLKKVESHGKSTENLESLANIYYLNGKMEEASKWFGELVTLNKDGLNPENYFSYAHALKALQNYEEADKMMQKFIQLKPEDSRSKFYNVNYLTIIEKASDDFKLQNLDVNSPYSDFGASIYQDNLIFASSRDDNAKIYNWNNQPFLDLFQLHTDGTVTKLQGNVNTKYHESSAAFTKDGKTMYFTRNNFFNGKFKKNSDNTHGLKIYKATLVNGLWENIESLPFNSDDYNIAHPSLNADGTKLYFASDMPGTIGSSDIFVVEINEDGTFGTPENLGPKINTEGRENFPFVSNNGTLYFASDGQLGLGGLDIFKFNDVENISHSEEMARNIGKPINSPKDDFAYIIDETTRKGFVSSNRNGGKGYDDIYSFNMPKCFKTISGIVRDRETQDSLAFAEITVFDEKGNVIKSLKSDKYGKFDFSLDCKIQSNNVKISKDKYFDETFALNIKTDLKEDIDLQLALQPSVPPIGTDLLKLLNLNPIYFDFDKTNIRPD